MLELAFGFAKSDVVLFELFVHALGGSSWHPIMRPYPGNDWILRLIKLISSLIILMQKSEIRLANSLRIYVLFCDLWFHYHRFGYSYHFNGLSDRRNFATFVRYILIHVFWKVIFLSLNCWSIWQILIPVTLFLSFDLTLKLDHLARRTADFRLSKEIWLVRIVGCCLLLESGLEEGLLGFDFLVLAFHRAGFHF